MKTWWYWHVGLFWYMRYKCLTSWFNNVHFLFNLLYLHNTSILCFLAIFRWTRRKEKRNVSSYTLIVTKETKQRERTGVFSLSKGLDFYLDWHWTLFHPVILVIMLVNQLLFDVLCFIVALRPLQNEHNVRASTGN